MTKSRAPSWPCSPYSPRDYVNDPARDCALCIEISENDDAGDSVSRCRRATRDIVRLDPEPGDEPRGDLPSPSARAMS